MFAETSQKKTGYKLKNMKNEDIHEDKVMPIACDLVLPGVIQKFIWCQVSWLNMHPHEGVNTTDTTVLFVPINMIKI